MAITEEDLGGSSGSIPIRGLVRFDENTPDDFTTQDGARFLRRGVVETDITKFDVTIWPDTFPVKVNEEDISGKGFVLDLSHAGIGATGNGKTVISNIRNSASPCLVSDGDFENFRASVSTLPIINANSSVIFSQGYFVQVIKDSSNVVISNDLYDTYTEVNTGLTGNITSIMGDDNAIVAWASSGTSKRSTDGGQTWSTVSTLQGVNTSKSAIKGGVWLIANQDDAWVSNDFGLTWTTYLNTYPSYNDAPYSDGTHFYTGHTTVFKSVNGIDWDAGVATKGDVPETAPIYINHANGIFVARASAQQVTYISKDAITWHEYFRNGDYSPGTQVPTGFCPTSDGVLIAYENNIVDTVKLKQYAGGINNTNINSEYSGCDFVKISEG